MVGKVNRRQSDRNGAIGWAREKLATPKWILLDTETTGIDDQAEIIQIGVLGNDGTRIMDNVFVRPASGYIPSGASAINHITYNMVSNAPTFADVWPTLEKYLIKYPVVIYNAAYDTKLIVQSAAKYRIKVPTYNVQCAMLRNAEFVGDWNESKQSYKWPKLTGGDHSAVGDCIATLELIKRMAASDIIEMDGLI